MLYTAKLSLCSFILKGRTTRQIHNAPQIHVLKTNKIKKEIGRCIPNISLLVASNRCLKRVKENKKGNNKKGKKKSTAGLEPATPAEKCLGGREQNHSATLTLT